jgi:Crinkler effector protein N-terminal domain
MSNDGMLWCWVQDDEHHHVFHANIECSADIFDLRAAIKAKKTSSRHIAVNSLKLLKVGEWYLQLFMHRY